MNNEHRRTCPVSAELKEEFPMFRALENLALNDVTKLQDLETPARQRSSKIVFLI